MRVIVCVLLRVHVARFNRVLSVSLSLCLPISLPLCLSVSTHLFLSRYLFSLSLPHSLSVFLRVPPHPSSSLLLTRTHTFSVT